MVNREYKCLRGREVKLEKFGGETNKKGGKTWRKFEEEQERGRRVKSFRMLGEVNHNEIVEKAYT